MANRTQVAGRLASLPAPIVTAVTPGYNGPGVPISYEQANGFQEAICRPLEDGNVVLDKDNYDQFAELLSGVHAIKSNIRSDVETTGVTTVATSAAVACNNTICSGTRSFAGGGTSNTNSGNNSASSGGYSNTNSGGGSASSGGYSNTNSGPHSASSGGYSNTNSGDFSASSGGYSNTNSGPHSASSGGYSNTNSGGRSASSGGYSNTNSGPHSASSGGSNTYNSGDRALNCASQYAENIDSNCAFGGYALVAPANHGDGLTNKNIKWKLHNDTGNAEFAGDVKFGGNVDDGTGAQVKVMAAGDILHLGGHHCNKTQTLGISVDWSSTAEIHTATSGISLGDTPDNTFRVAVINTDGSAQSIKPGQSILVPVTLNGLKILGGYAYVSATTAAASMQKTRWVVGGYYSAAAEDHIALTQVGETAGVVGAATADSTAITVHLHVITPITTIA